MPKGLLLAMLTIIVDMSAVIVLAGTPGHSNLSIGLVVAGITLTLKCGIMLGSYLERIDVFDDC